MKPSLLAVALLFALVPGCRSLPSPGTAPRPDTMIAGRVHVAAWSEDGGAFLVIFRPGPAWVRGKPVTEQPLREHGRYLLSLFVSGTLRAAGPFTDDTGGAVVLRASNEAQARALVAADPAVTTGVFTYEIHPWGLVPWERHVR